MMDIYSTNYVDHFILQNKLSICFSPVVDNLLNVAFVIFAYIQCNSVSSYAHCTLFVQIQACTWGPAFNLLSTYVSTWLHACVIYFSKNSVLKLSWQVSRLRACAFLVAHAHC